MKQFCPALKCVVIGLVLACTCIAQSGGSFNITKSVIAGGGANSNGGTFGVTGTIAQTNAGDNSTGGLFAVKSGFWQSFLAPTAAGVSISGRVLRFSGVPIGKAYVTLTDGSGHTWVALSSPLGHYRFDDIPTGETYIISVNSKSYQFVPRVVTVLDELTELDLVAMP